MLYTSERDTHSLTVSLTYIHFKGECANSAPVNTTQYMSEKIREEAVDSGLTQVGLETNSLSRQETGRAGYGGR